MRYIIYVIITLSLLGCNKEHDRWTFLWISKDRVRIQIDDMAYSACSYLKEYAVPRTHSDEIICINTNNGTIEK